MDLNKAWVIKWSASGNHVNHLIKKYSPQGAVIDILSCRKSFDDAFSYTKNLYKLFVLSLSEKLPFAHYTKGIKSSEAFFKLIPIFTHYKSSWYKNIIKEEIRNPVSMTARKKWKEGFEKNSRYAIIGHNPHLELIEAFNLKEKTTKDGTVLVTWEVHEMGQIRKEKSF